ncbi:MAG: DegV family protein [Eubacteriales bacterium]|nr:DegV family protein [Eubacteriales bacterium]
MGRCKVFTNSVSDISPELAREYNITIVPDVVLFRDREYFCGVDMDPPKLYKMMRENPKLPSTSHPNPSIYAEWFEKAADYDEIVCVNVSSKMSGSYSTATQTALAMAADGFKPVIYTYDSLQVSLGLAYLVIKAAELAQTGATAKEVIAHLDGIRDKVGVYFWMKSLENARKGGRVGDIKCLTADFLGIRPVLMFRDGTVHDVNLMRSYDKAMMRVAKYYQDRARKGGRVFVGHADNEKDALRLKQRILEFDPDAQISIEWVGAAIGIYSGEGAVCVVFGE